MTYHYFSKQTMKFHHAFNFYLHVEMPPQRLNVILLYQRVRGTYFHESLSLVSLANAKKIDRCILALLIEGIAGATRKTYDNASRNVIAVLSILICTAQD